MSTLLKMQKFHPLCSRCIGMYPLQNRWTVLRYLQCYENFSECCTHLILPETALFSPTPTFAKEPLIVDNGNLVKVRMINKIQQIENDNRREILIRKYIKFESIVKISKEMFISRQGIYYHLELGEKEIEKLI